MTLTHNLGGNADNYAIQLWFMDTDGPYGLNARAYGGLEANGNHFGAAWGHLTDNTIAIHRFSNDTVADQVRVWVWVPQTPEYCSDWTSFNQGQTMTFTHSLGGDVNDYVVGLWFSGTVGINQWAYGGNEDGGNYYGAYWHNLDNSTIQVTRLANDPYASQVRVCIQFTAPPQFDSGWVDVAPGATTAIDHNLGGDPSQYILRTEFQDTAAAGLGINHYAAGGITIDGSPDRYEGVNWENLTATALDVFRRPDDQYADQVRVRIWQRFMVYLPLVLRN